MGLSPATTRTRSGPKCMDNSLGDEEVFIGDGVCNTAMYACLWVWTGREFVCLWDFQRMRELKSVNFVINYIEIISFERLHLFLFP